MAHDSYFALDGVECLSVAIVAMERDACEVAIGKLQAFYIVG